MLFKYLDSTKSGLLFEGAVYLTPPKFLNDRTEFAFKVESFNRETALLEAARCEGIYASQFRAPAADENTRILRYAAFLESEEYHLSLAHCFQDEFSTQYGVVSLSEDPASVRMWQKYAEGFSGLVVGIKNCDSRFTSEGYSVWGTALNVAAIQVKYKTGVIRLKRTRSVKQMLDAICTKQCFYWRYEKEWRIVLPLAKGLQRQMPNGDFHYFLPVPPSAIDLLILGQGASQSLRRACAQFIHDNRDHVIRVQEAGLVSNGSKVEFRDLDLSYS